MKSQRYIPHGLILEFVKVLFEFKLGFKFEFKNKFVFNLRNRI